MSLVFLGVGSNTDAAEHIRAGIGTLRAKFGKVEISPVYETPAVGFDGHCFLNLAASVETALGPLELKHFLNELEAGHGRKRALAKFSDRTLDIDILLYDDLYLISPQLEIPRAEILQYAHVLKPLADLAPQLVHPVELRTIGAIWQTFSQPDSEFRVADLDLSPVTKGT